MRINRSISPRNYDFNLQIERMKLVVVVEENPETVGMRRMCPLGKNGHLPGGAADVPDAARLLPPPPRLVWLLLRWGTPNGQIVGGPGRAFVAVRRQSACCTLPKGRDPRVCLEVRRIMDEEDAEMGKKNMGMIVFIRSPDAELQQQCLILKFLGPAVLCPIRLDHLVEQSGSCPVSPPSSALPLPSPIRNMSSSRFSRPHSSSRPRDSFFSRANSPIALPAVPSKEPRSSE